MEIILNKFVKGTKEVLGAQLVGVYLHGSAVMGCYNPAKSDLDLIVVVNDSMTLESKKAFMDMVVELNGIAPDKGIEMSIVTSRACNPFIYPTPFQLHFSVMHLNWYKDNPDDYIEKMNGTDKDLAAHFMIIRKRGKCLCGLPIEDVFAEIPKEAYMDSIWNDIMDARDDIVEDTMYVTLNLARVLAYQKEELVLSKKEGGEWALRNLPQEYYSLIRDSLREYVEGAEVIYDKRCAVKYAEFMLRRIGAEQAYL